MLGKPKFKCDDRVQFKILIRDKEDYDEYKEYTLCGTVYIVDKYGCFSIPDEVCYDIMVEDSPIGEPCLYKHIAEPNLVLV